MLSSSRELSSLADVVQNSFAVHISCLRLQIEYGADFGGALTLHWSTARVAFHPKENEADLLLSCRAFCLPWNSVFNL